MTSQSRYLLGICCLLISLTPAVQAQVAQQAQANTSAPQTRWPGYLQRGRVGLAPQQHVKLQPDAKANPFAAPISSTATPLPAADAMSQAVLAESSQLQTITEQPQPIFDPSVVTASELAIVGQPAIQQASCSSCGVVGGDCDSGGCLSGHGNDCNCWVRSPGTPCTTSNPCYGPMYWLGADYVIWGFQPADAPALATTSPDGTVREAAGVLGEDGTEIIFGDREFHTGMRTGNRFTGGMWLNRIRTIGIQASFMSIENSSENFTAGVADFGILARPFFDLELNEEDSRLINFPTIVTGTLTINSRSDFDMLEVMLFTPLSYPIGQARVFGGYRHMGLEESIRIEESTTSQESPTLGSTFDLFDIFRVQNDFHGPQAAVHYVRPLSQCWSYDILGKAAIGATRTVTTVNGETVTTTADGDSTTQTGGLLALDSNIGEFTDTELSSVFEFGLNLRRTFRNGLHFSVGYTFLHWSNVARAVEQIDLTVNPTQIPPGTLSGQPRPQNRFKRGGLWAQGINLGLEYRF